MKTTVIVTGIRKVDRRLKSLVPRLQKKVIRQGIRAGLKVIKAEMQNQAPVKTGLMRASVKVRASKFRKRGEIKMVAFISGNVPALVKSYGPDKKRFFYPAGVEFGVKQKNHPHAKPKNSAIEYYEKEAQKPNPFAKRAFQIAGEPSRQRAIEVILEGIEREASKS